MRARICLLDRGSHRSKHRGEGPRVLIFRPKDRVRGKVTYTKVRQIQAESFVGIANVSTFWRPTGNRLETRTARMCIGILSVAREPRYIDATVGSLMDGLTTDERDELHLIALLPYSDPTRHSAYREPWRHNLVDEVIHYNTSTTQSDHIIALENEEAPFREKGLYDYGLLVGSCLDKTNAPYIAVFEDDIVATPDWYNQTLAGLAESEAKLSGVYDQSREFLYLRLFYTEQFSAGTAKTGSSTRCGRSCRSVHHGLSCFVLVCGTIKGNGFWRREWLRWLAPQQHLCQSCFSLLWAERLCSHFPPACV